MLANVNLACRSKDGVDLTSSERIVLDSVVSDGQYTLTIVSAELSDAGQYTVTASNQAGKCQCTATLLVQGQPLIMWTISHTGVARIWM